MLKNVHVLMEYEDGLYTDVLRVMSDSAFNQFRERAIEEQRAYQKRRIEDLLSAKAEQETMLAQAKKDVSDINHKLEQKKKFIAIYQKNNCTNCIRTERERRKSLLGDKLTLEAKIRAFKNEIAAKARQIFEAQNRENPLLFADYLRDNHYRILTKPVFYHHDDTAVVDRDIYED